jgi:hypothetical protein
MQRDHSQGTGHPDDFPNVTEIRLVRLDRTPQLGESLSSGTRYRPHFLIHRHNP